MKTYINSLFVLLFFVFGCNDISTIEPQMVPDEISEEPVEKVKSKATSESTKKVKKSLKEDELHPLSRTPLEFQLKGISCKEGDVRESYCKGFGFIGSQTCVGVKNWTRPTCPNGSPITSGSSRLVVATKRMIHTEGFSDLLKTMYSGSQYYTVISLEEIVNVMPRDSIAESIRAFTEKIKYTDLPLLKTLLLIGDTEWSTGIDATELKENDVMIPLKLVTSRKQHYESATEISWLSTSYLGFNSEDLDVNPGHRYWNPDLVINRNVDVGFIQADGRKICKEICPALEDAACTVCKTDLQIYAEKIRAWHYDEGFKVTQFDTGKCWPQQGNWGLNIDNKYYDGISHVINFYDCSDSSVNFGDLGQYGTNDKATVMAIVGHGNPAGTKYPGRYYYNGNSVFNGPVYMYSCSAGGVDLRTDPLLQSQLLNPDGTIALIAHSRTMNTPVYDIWKDMLKEKWLTVSEAAYGTMYRRLLSYGTRSLFMDMLDMVIGGNPETQLYEPTYGVRVLNYRFNEDGSADAYLKVTAKRESTVQVRFGKTKLGNLYIDDYGYEHMEVHVTPEDGNLEKDVFNISRADLGYKSCYVGKLESRLYEVPVRVQKPIQISDDVYRVSVYLPKHTVLASTVNVVIEIVTRECEEGTDSSCFWDGVGKLQTHVVGDNTYTHQDMVDSFDAKFNLKKFNPNDNEYVRAIRVVLKHKDGDRVYGMGHLKIDDGVLDWLRLF